MPYDTSLVQTIRGMTEIPTTQSTRVTKCACCTSGLDSSCNHESSAECNKIRYLYSANCVLYLDSWSLCNAVHSAVINRGVNNLLHYPENKTSYNVQEIDAIGR